MKTTGRNFVVKHDFNRASTHRDRKNDYSREWSLEEELDEPGKDDGDFIEGVSDDSKEGSEQLT